MKKVNGYSVQTFSFNEKYLVDIVVNYDLYEAWLFRDNCGIKDFMFGVLKNDMSYEEFIDTVELNLELENYIEFYEEEYGE